MKQAAIGAFSQELLAAPALAFPLARGVDFQGTVCDLVRQSQSGVVHVLCVQFRGKGGGGYDMAFLAPLRGLVEMQWALLLLYFTQKFAFQWSCLPGLAAGMPYPRSRPWKPLLRPDTK